MNLMCVCWLSGQCLTCSARDLMRWKRPMKELIPLFHRAFCSSFTRRKQGLAYFFWSPMEDYCVTVGWIWFMFVDYQVSVWRVGSDLMRWKRPMKELSAELSSPSDAISGRKSSQCWINAESVWCVSDSCCVWDVSSRRLTRVCWVSDD